MFFSDKGTRDLLPLIELHLDEITGPPPEFDGDPTPAANVPLQANPAEIPSAANSPPAELETDKDGPETSSAGDPVPSPANNSVAQPAGGGDTVTIHEISIPLDQSFFEGKPVMLTFRGATGELEHNADAGQAANASSHVADSPISNSAAGAPGVPGVPDDAHTINVTQYAEVEQDASIFVSGYVGEVVARVHIDQRLVMDQDVDISFTIDGDGHFSVLLDQDMRIDQDIWIDINIWDEDGVLYVELFVRDAVEVEQDTAIDLEISDGPPGGTVEVNQDLELDQDVHIQIDIEDELEERYMITTKVDVVQAAYADETAVVSITDRNGEIDLDVDASQTAYVDQETVVHADFVLV
jgi:hypothetical protein